jgi:predicted RNA polymerase sigma factor
MYSVQRSTHRTTLAGAHVLMQEQDAAMIWDRSVVSRKQILVVNHEAEFSPKLADWLNADGYEVITD